MGFSEVRAYILSSSDPKDSPSRVLAAWTNSGWLTIWRTLLLGEVAAHVALL